MSNTDYKDSIEENLEIFQRKNIVSGQIINNQKRNSIKTVGYHSHMELRLRSVFHLILKF